mgnify:CR=1 FL=1
MDVSKQNEILVEAMKAIDEILRHNPDAQEPPRYRNARAAKIVKDVLNKIKED